MSPGQNDLNPKHGYPPCHTHVHPNGFGCFDERVVVKQQIKHAKKKKKHQKGIEERHPPGTHPPDSSTALETSLTGTSQKH